MELGVFLRSQPGTQPGSCPEGLPAGWHTALLCWSWWLQTCFPERTYTGSSFSPNSPLRCILWPCFWPCFWSHLCSWLNSGSGTSPCGAWNCLWILCTCTQLFLLCSVPVGPYPLMKAQLMLGLPLAPGSSFLGSSSPVQLFAEVCLDI